MNRPSGDNPIANQPWGRQTLDDAAELKLVFIVVIIPVFGFNFAGVNRAVGPHAALDFDKNADSYWAVLHLYPGRGRDVDRAAAYHPISDQPGRRQALDNAAEFKVIIIAVVQTGCGACQRGRWNQGELQDQRGNE
jgi:hypothetical protein